MTKTIHNFHVDCPRKWVYDGDGNINYGGKFYNRAQLEQILADIGDGHPQPGQSWRVDIIDVIQRGVSNQYTISFEHVIVDSLKWVHDEQLLQELTWEPEKIASLRRTSSGALHYVLMQAAFTAGYHGLDCESELHIQIGKEYDPLASENDQVDEPDHTLQPNARIENWLRRNVLN